MNKSPNEKILTLSPDPAKKGVNIDKDRYEYIKDVIFDVLKSSGPLSSSALVEGVVEYINSRGGVDYSIGWYAMAVRLDLEAKGRVHYSRGTKKPVISLPE